MQEILANQTSVTVQLLDKICVLFKINLAKRGCAARCAEKLSLSVRFSLKKEAAPHSRAKRSRRSLSLLKSDYRKGTAFPHISGQSPKSVLLRHLLLTEN